MLMGPVEDDQTGAAMHGFPVDRIIIHQSTAAVRL
jgi:hypothetical protein